MKALINAEIHPVEGAEIKDGFILFDEETGKIVNFGEMKNFEPPIGIDTEDLAGMKVYPGFVDAHCHLGMWEDGLGFEGDDGNEATDPATPQLHGSDSINPMDRCFSEAAAAGVTCVVTGPGSANAIGGQLCAIKTAGRRVDRMLVRDPVAMKMALGENPKTVYHGRNLAPETRMATAAIIRENLRKAQKYREDLDKSLEDDEIDPPEYDAKCEALLPVLRRELPVHIHCHRADDIFTAIRIAREFNLDFHPIHCTEGHLIAEELCEEKVMPVLGPILSDRSKPELRNQSITGAGILWKAGVKFALCTDHPVIPIQYLPLCAGLIVRGGLPYEEALRAITLNPAELLGLSDRIGSIRAGKDADLVVYGRDADPLSVYAVPEAVYINGKEVCRGKRQ